MSSNQSMAGWHTLRRMCGTMRRRDAGRVCVCRSRLPVDSDVMLMASLSRKLRGVQTRLLQEHIFSSCQHRFNYTRTHKTSKDKHSWEHSEQSEVENRYLTASCAALQRGLNFPPFYHSPQLHYWTAKMEVWWRPLQIKGEVHETGQKRRAAFSGGTAGNWVIQGSLKHL